MVYNILTVHAAVRRMVWAWEALSWLSFPIFSAAKPAKPARGSGRAAAGAGNGNGHDGAAHQRREFLRHVGSRMGEENEALRNLLSDTGRKIGELDDLKDAFEKIVAPFNKTLRALEQEKSQSLSLSNMLAEARTAYDTLRTEFYQVEKKAIALESEAEKLREDLELVARDRTAAWRARGSN